LLVCLSLTAYVWLLSHNSNQASAQAYLTKPINVKEFLRMVGGILGS